MSIPEVNPEATAHPRPALATMLAYILCPLFALVAIYALWQVTSLANLGVNTAPFYGHVTLLVIAVTALATACGIAAATYARDSAEQIASVNAHGLERRARYNQNMLRLISDHLPNILLIADRDGRIWFANREAGLLARKDPADMNGKTIERTFAGRTATTMLERVKNALGAHAPVVTVDRYDEMTGPRYMETYYLPLPEGEDLKNVALVMQRNITSTIVEHERQEQTFRQLIDTLIAVVDRRDPYAAGHSIRVGIMAEAIARQMQLDEQSIEASRIAGSLMNLGKVLVPREILTKTTPLDSEELKQVRKAILTSADILSLISFETPVVPTLRQVLERFDGKGVPEGRRDEHIILTARVVSVANAFIALVSPRAHRPGISVDGALDLLRRDIGTIYDPRVVEALAGYLAANPNVQQTMLEPPPELRSVVGIQDITD